MLLPTKVPTHLHVTYDLDDLCSLLSSMSQGAQGKSNGEQLRTVGMPAYLCQNSSSDYQSNAKHFNVILWKKFSPLYQCVAKVLSDFLREQVYFSINTAIPGFHVIRNTVNHPSYYGGVPHVDSSYLHVPVLSNISHPTEQYSFTLLLSESGENIGLDYWTPETSEQQAGETVPHAFEQYARGYMSIFTSTLVHRISPFDNFQERITLQGHVIRFKNKLIAYW